MTIINTLTLSSLIYISSMIYTPQEALKEINDITQKQIFGRENHQNHHVRMFVLCQRSVEVSSQYPKQYQHLAYYQLHCCYLEHKLTTSPEVYYNFCLIFYVQHYFLCAIYMYQTKLMKNTRISSFQVFRHVSYYVIL